MGCPFCMTMLRDGVNETGQEEKLKVLDVAEIVASALAEPGLDSAPGGAGSTSPGGRSS